MQIHHNNHRFRTLFHGLCSGAAFLSLSSLAFAAPITVDFYFDLDSSATTGCSVVVPQRTIGGFEKKLTLSLDDATNNISSATVAQCVGGTLTAPTSLDLTKWGMADDPENPVQSIVSGVLPRSLFPVDPTGVVITSSTGGTTVDVLDGGNPTFASLGALAIDDTPQPVPALGALSLLLLVTAFVGLSWFLWRRNKANEQSAVKNLITVLLVGALASGHSNRADAASSTTVTEPTAQATSELSTIANGDILGVTFSKTSPTSDINVRITLRKADAAISLPKMGENSANEFIKTPIGLIAENKLILMKYARVSKSEAISFLQLQGLTVVAGSDNGTFEVRTPDGTFDQLKARRDALRRSASDKFYYVHFLSLPTLNGFTSNDPSLNNADTRWGFDSIKAPAAWDILSGLPSSPTSMGVVDSGFRNFDELTDLTFASVQNGGSFWDCAVIYAQGNWDVISGQSTAFPEFCSVHGYHVSGTIGAKSNNAFGTLGVGSAVNPIRIHARGNVGDVKRIEDVFEVADSARGVNFSLGNSYLPNKVTGSTIPLVQEEEIRDLRRQHVNAWLNYWTNTLKPTKPTGWALNSVIVAASGNSGNWRYESTGLPPSAEDAAFFLASGDATTDPFVRDQLLPNLLAVGAHDRNRNILTFTQLPETQAIKNVFLLAPGENIYSTVPNIFSADPTPVMGLQKLSGTSMAAPHVTGVVALIEQANPALRSSEVAKVLLNSADNKNGTTWLGTSDTDYRYLNAEMSVRNARAPVITSATKTSGGTVGSATGFTVHIDPTRAGAIKFEMDVGDGTGWRTISDTRALMSQTQFLPAHTFAAAGIKTVHFRVTDILGRSGVTQIDVNVTDVTPLAQCSAGITAGAANAPTNPYSTDYVIGAANVKSCKHGDAYLGFSAFNPQQGIGMLYIHVDDVNDLSTADPYLVKEGNGSWSEYGYQSYVEVLFDVGADGVTTPNSDFSVYTAGDGFTQHLTDLSLCTPWVPDGYVVTGFNPPAGTIYKERMFLTKVFPGGGVNGCLTYSKYWRSFDPSAKSATAHRQHILGIPIAQIPFVNKEAKISLQSLRSNTTAVVTNTFIVRLP